MKTIAVVSTPEHGHRLQIGESPWLRAIVEKLAMRYNPLWGWDYQILNAIVGWSSAKERILVAVPVGHSCEVAEKLWPGYGGCWHEDDDEDEVIHNPGSAP